MRDKIITLDEFIGKEIKEADKKGKGFKETEVGVIPEGWEVKKLGEIIELIESGGRPKGGVSHIKEGIPSIGGGHLNDSGGFTGCPTIT
jgi:type I restriction enzyme S subunit